MEFSRQFQMLITLEIPRGGSIWPPFDPLSVLLNFLRNPLEFNPLEFFRKKIGNPRGFNLWSFDGLINVGGLKFLSKFSVFSIATLYISCHNLAELWPRTKFCHQNIPQGSLWKCPADIYNLYMEIVVVWEILAKISRGSNDPTWVFMLIKRAWYF